MKARGKKPHPVFVWTTVLVSIPAGRGRAQSLVAVYEFSAPDYPATTNSDGIAPNGLVLSGNHLYGTANNGSTAGNGTVFAVNSDGTDFTNLHSFNPDPLNNNYAEANSDEANPYGLVLSGNTLYDTTEIGGSMNEGTVSTLPLSAASPQLAIALSSTNVNLTWPVSAADFLLQTNGDLTTTNWSDFAGTISTNGTLESVSVKPSAGDLFFRLAKP